MLENRGNEQQKTNAEIFISFTNSRLRYIRNNPKQHFDKIQQTISEQMSTHIIAKW
jgi:hypothetical protein